jgi:purine-binding chemotaxis protein CheW
MREQIAAVAQDDTMQISTFYLDETLCGIDIDLVQEINGDLSFTPVPLSDEYVLGVMNLRGQIVTVIDQSRKIGFAPVTITPDSRVVIVRSQGESIGVVVDMVK